jgi:hypothetical protein
MTDDRLAGDEERQRVLRQVSHLTTPFSLLGLSYHSEWPYPQLRASVLRLYIHENRPDDLQTPWPTDMAAPHPLASIPTGVSLPLHFAPGIADPAQDTSSSKKRKRSAKEVIGLRCE